MENQSLSRRDFLKGLGALGLGALAVSSPWLSAFSEVDHTAKDKCRMGVIGVGSRGRFHLKNLVDNPKVDIVAVADVYQPSIDEALKITPQAKVYKDYRRLLDDKTIDCVLIATPLYTHCQITLDAMDAGKHVLCEKCLGYTMEENFRMYQKHCETGLIFFSGQQRLFDPRYIKVMGLIHQGLFGKITCIHSFWNRNNDWRRDVPDPKLERFINWRLYKAYSKGLMSELACHQLQVGTWALGRLPVKVMGHGAINYWGGGREVYDNINTLYVFDDGRQMTWGSDVANKFYGLEEQILGSKGTVEPEHGKYYFENVAPAPAFLQLINQWENDIFGDTRFAGTSWAPETANVNHGEYILGHRPTGEDGSSLLVDAFAEAVITGRQPRRVAEEGYYASLLCLWGYEALERGEILDFPQKYAIDYNVYHTKGIKS